MMVTTIAGRIYFGKSYGWTDSDDNERTMFRGRINYRDPRNGNYHDIDGVCFNDFGQNGGRVAFLEEHFSAPESKEDGNGGQAVILVGYIRPTQKRHTVKVDLNTKQGKKTIEVSDVPYESYEFVIEDAYFPPRSKGDSSNESNASLDLEDDEIDFDDIQASAASEESSEEEPQEETVEEPKKRKAPAKRKTASKTTKSTSKSKAKAKAEAEDEDDDFFDDEKSA